MPKKYSYENEYIRVSFDESKCTHVGFCFKELNAVFNGDRNPPIQLNGAPIAEIMRMVEKCPSSALIYERLDGEANETAADKAIATIVPTGPLAMRGKLTLDGQSYTRLTLCRCGKSKNPPFCDGTHNQHSFDDGKTVPIETVTDTASDIALTTYPNGPVGFSGNITFYSSTGAVICERNEGAICRCGASKTKPFCDGSHTNKEAW